jgi:hypothetical protein
MVMAAPTDPIVAYDTLDSVVVGIRVDEATYRSARGEILTPVCNLGGRLTSHDCSLWYRWVDEGLTEPGG